MPSTPPIRKFRSADRLRVLVDAEPRRADLNFLLGQALFADGRCVATSDAVSVLVDLETNRSTPMPDALRQAYRVLSDG